MSGPVARSRLLPEIREARRQAAAAKSRLRKVILKAQNSCRHDLAAQRNWSSGYFGRHDSIRICLHCGYEEHCPYGTTSFGTWPDGGLTGIALGGVIKCFERTYLTPTRFPKDCIVMVAEDIFKHRPTYRV